jgi:hypothetical protein
VEQSRLYISTQQQLEKSTANGTSKSMNIGNTIAGSCIKIKGLQTTTIGRVVIGATGIKK